MLFFEPAAAVSAPQICRARCSAKAGGMACAISLRVAHGIPMISRASSRFFGLRHLPPVFFFRSPSCADPVPLTSTGSGCAAWLQAGTVSGTLLSKIRCRRTRSPKDEPQSITGFSSGASSGPFSLRSWRRSANGGGIIRAPSASSCRSESSRRSCQPSVSRSAPASMSAAQKSIMPLLPGVPTSRSPRHSTSEQNAS